MMKIAFLSAEFRPLAKIGGLADVALELPRALLQLGLEVRLFMPRYSHINLDEIGARQLADIVVQRGKETIQAQFYAVEIMDVPVFLVDGPSLSQAPEVYPGQPLEGERFVFYSVAVVNYFQQSGWIPDVMHANDWHTAAAVPYMAQQTAAQGSAAGLDQTGTLLTIHNLPYMGVGSEPAVRAYGIQPVQEDTLPDWAREIPLPMGIALADHVNTVSPTYALEIQTHEYGSGLDGLLISRRDHLSGILNGIDPESWDPRTDPELPATFSSVSLDRKLVGKKVLQHELSLPEADEPLLAMVTRLDNQKGVDIMLDALEGMLDVPWQFVLLGTGSHHLESRCKEFSSRHSGRARAVLKYDAGLARRIYAGSDMILVPSRYEPCGLAQIIAMRYGTIPVVRATGGLKDTVPDYRGESGIGFVFEEASDDAFQQALRTAITAYQDSALWNILQKRAMAADYSWECSAEQYRDLYAKVSKVQEKSL
jgi:starch synthase